MSYYRNQSTDLIWNSSTNSYQSIPTNDRFDSVQIGLSAFWTDNGTVLPDIVSVDFSYVPFINNWMLWTFDVRDGYTSSLQSVSKINPFTVWMVECFKNCTNFTTLDAFPESLIDMSGCFIGCTSLQTVPVIPDSVEYMINTFEGCTSLTGNIVIESSIITDVTDCFVNTSLTKNVYIPFNSTTYNTFIAAGYDANGTKEGVYLKDINTL